MLILHSFIGARNSSRCGVRLAEGIALLPRGVFLPQRTAVNHPTSDQASSAPEHIGLLRRGRIEKALMPQPLAEIEVQRRDFKTPSW